MTTEAERLKPAYRRGEAALHRLWKGLAWERHPLTRVASLDRCAQITDRGADVDEPGEAGAGWRRLEARLLRIIAQAERGQAAGRYTPLGDEELEAPVLPLLVAYAQGKQPQETLYALAEAWSSVVDPDVAQVVLSVEVPRPPAEVTALVVVDTLVIVGLVVAVLVGGQALAAWLGGHRWVATAVTLGSAAVIARGFLRDIALRVVGR